MAGAGMGYDSPVHWKIYRHGRFILKFILWYFLGNIKNKGIYKKTWDGPTMV